MGEETKIVDIQAESGGTLIQIDIKNSKGSDRIFVEVRDIFLALNNYIYTRYDKDLTTQGAERIDPTAPPYGLLLKEPVNKD